MKMKIWGRIHQPFSRTFFVFFSKICKFECKTTSDWLIVWFSQSEVMLHSNAYKYEKIRRSRLRMSSRTVGEYRPCYYTFSQSVSYRQER